MTSSLMLVRFLLGFKLSKQCLLLIKESKVEGTLMCSIAVLYHTLCSLKGDNSIVIGSKT